MFKEGCRVICFTVTGWADGTYVRAGKNPGEHYVLVNGEEHFISFGEIAAV